MIDLGPPGDEKCAKAIGFVGQNEDACFCAMIALEIDFGSIFDHFWDRFWTDFGVQKAPQRHPKTTQNGVQKRYDF